MKANILIEKLSEISEAFDNPEIEFVITDDCLWERLPSGRYELKETVLSFEDMFKKDNSVRIYLREG